MKLQWFVVPTYRVLNLIPGKYDLSSDTELLCMTFSKLNANCNLDVVKQRCDVNITVYSLTSAVTNSTPQR